MTPASDRISVAAAAANAAATASDDVRDQDNVDADDEIVMTSTVGRG
jgi:hypothetical protein